MRRVAAALIGTLAVLGILTAPASAAPHDAPWATGTYGGTLLDPQAGDTNMAMYH
ncbi:hypothetical protein ABTY53_11660 [Streptomyces noursei]|uniref:hypothetical protein n=1 Tax=Streptomyces noursei TaxID=1971 RepID=UPI0033176425